MNLLSSALRKYIFLLTVGYLKGEVKGQLFYKKNCEILFLCEFSVLFHLLRTVQNETSMFINCNKNQLGADNLYPIKSPLNSAILSFSVFLFFLSWFPSFPSLLLECCLAVKEKLYYDSEKISQILKFKQYSSSQTHSLHKSKSLRYILSHQIFLLVYVNLDRSQVVWILL